MNKLIERIDSGSANVKGLRMLYPLADGVLFQVIVRGLEVTNDGVKVKAAPVDGVGHFLCPPDKLIDDCKESRELHFRHAAADAYTSEHFSRWHSCDTKRGATKALFESLAPAKRKRYAAENPNVVSYSKMNIYDLRAHWNKLIALEFDIEAECC